MDSFDIFSKSVPVSRETFERLKLYIEFVLHWNKKINLVSNSTVDEIWVRHMLDSAQLSKYVPRETNVLVDMGSGGGFPGIVLAIMGAANNFHLIESDRRKSAFLREATQFVNANIQIHNERIERLEGIKANVIVARALAPLNQLLEWSYKFAGPETEFIFPKGQNFKEELNEISTIYSYDEEIFPSISAANGWIVKLKHVTIKKI